MSGSDIADCPMCCDTGRVAETTEKPCPMCRSQEPPQGSPSNSSDLLARFSPQTAKVDGAVVVVEKWGDHTYVAGPDRKDQVVLFVKHHDYFKIVFLRDILGVRMPPVNYQI
jgi:hypothetical protein